MELITDMTEFNNNNKMLAESTLERWDNKETSGNKSQEN